MSSIPGKDALRRKRWIDGFVLFFFESRDKFGGRQDLADAADALTAGLPGFTFSLSRFHIEELPLSPW